MEPRTHEGVSERYVGRPVDLADGRATVELETDPEMQVDGSGLVHGGFVFGVADYAAMLAVNEPTVVLAGADVDFPAPTTVGETIRATATDEDGTGSRRTVAVTARADDSVVCEGTFDCVVPDEHVLDG